MRGGQPATLIFHEHSMSLRTWSMSDMVMFRQECRPVGNEWKSSARQSQAITSGYDPYH